MSDTTAQLLNAAQLATVRAEFSGLSSEVIFLDNAGGSQVLTRVADRIRDYLLTTSVQLGASYATSAKAKERVLAARAAMGTLVNARYDDEVVMGGSTTGLMFLLCQAIRPSIRAGDEIIITNTDHEANIGAWSRLAEVGAVIKVWEVNRDSLQLELADLDGLLTSRTRWVTMTHASNILGTVNPVARVADKVHAVGAKLCVDGVAYAPHRLVDVQASGADVYVFSFYKVFGPHYALMWVERELLLLLPTLNHHFIGPEVIPYKLQPGNVNFELSYGCVGINEYLMAMGQHLCGFSSILPPRMAMQAAFDVFARHEDALAEQLLSYLRERRSVRIIGLPRVTNGDRVPTISFVVEGVPSERVVTAMDAHHIGIRYGDFYARRLADALGLGAYGGVVRVSMAHYNTADEIDALVDKLDECLPKS